MFDKVLSTSVKCSIVVIVNIIMDILLFPQQEMYSALF